MALDLDIRQVLLEVRRRGNLSQERLAQLLGVSFVSINRWERGAGSPSPTQIAKIKALHERLRSEPVARLQPEAESGVFSSRGVRRRLTALPLFAGLPPPVALAPAPLAPIVSRLTEGHCYAPEHHPRLEALLAAPRAAAPTVDAPPALGVSAGKNTYTYDAHTYHTKVPPQGIAELLAHYLPRGGLVLDPFAGSGMTGVACRAHGYDCVLNELSPAACFIADRFTTRLDPALFAAGVQRVLDEVRDVRAALYTTTCRECGRPTELLYTVWSYRVICDRCGHEFQLWDHCRRYGRRVRDHKIISAFPCPSCGQTVQKSRLRRTVAEPVAVGYKCCGSRQQEVTHPPSQEDRDCIARVSDGSRAARGYYPTTSLPDGVNLRQPKNHGIDRVDQFYTPRNLAALSHLWRAIHRVEDPQLAGQLAFVFTSLYQRVTRLSEFRFWGGSGNTARYNVPFISNEANVFLTFARKARTIQDHLETTATHFAGTTAVVRNSATSLAFLPDASVDLVFTDPPFGANINYSDMNFLWESWLGAFTDTTQEAIVNKLQGKGVAEYRQLMTRSLRECHRVLRDRHWLLLVFMNSSKEVWAALRGALEDAGFAIRQIDVFDKQHGTFKQFVSENTAGCDLVLHCRKVAPGPTGAATAVGHTPEESVAHFLERVDIAKRTNAYLHVARADELDTRSLYSEWLAQAILAGQEPLDFARFRDLIEQWRRGPRPDGAEGEGRARDGR